VWVGRGSVMEYFTLGPPNSPPTIGLRLAIRIAIASRASIQNTVTEKPKLEIQSGQGNNILILLNNVNNL